MLQYVIKNSLHRDENSRRQKCLESISISSVTWELLVFYPWRQRQFDDDKLNREKKRRKEEEKRTAQ